MDNNKLEKIKKAFINCSQPRSNYAIKNFVVGDHQTSERQYHQCVIELWMKTIFIKRTQIQSLMKDREIKDCKDDLKLELLKLDKDELEFAIQGAIREFNTLYSIFESFPEYTYEQLQAAEEKYWIHRLSRQAQLDLESTGRISTGNLDALRQINMTPDFGKIFLEKNKNIIKQNTLENKNI